MLTTALEPTTATLAAPTAFYLAGRGGPLFGWLHAGRPGVTHGVVLCPPVGHEQLHSHRALRHLAAAVARAGFPVLRFDYHGSGDSAGFDDDPDRLPTGRQNVRDGVRWMRDQLGCDRVSLVGLRLGATLAALAAADEPVDQLVLWAPVVSGRRYVRELRALSAATGGSDLPSEAAADLGTIDLLTVRPQCRRALIVGRDDLPTDSRLHAHLSAQGIATEQVVQPGYADLMAEPHHTRVPHAAIDHVAGWLRADDQTTNGCLLDPECPTTAFVPVADDRSVREEACVIPGEPRLFGIVTEPTTGDILRPWVVLLNAGSTHRAGPGRLHVAVARALAARGFPCLRLDLGGIGDSPAADPARENDPYPATGFADIDRVLHFLAETRGARRVVLAGLCSGAYFAFQSAAQLTNPVLAGSIAVNPLTFFWKDGLSVDEAPTHDLRRMHYYLTAALRPGKWLKVLRGRTKIGVRGALRLLADRWRLARRAGCPARPDTYPTPASAAHPERPDVPGDLARIVRHGRGLAFLFAKSEPGAWILKVSAGRGLTRLQRSGQVRVEVIDGADHTFLNRAGRQALMDAMADWLQADPVPSGANVSPGSGARTRR